MSMQKQDAIDAFQGQIKKIRVVKATARFGATFTGWCRDTRVALSHIFPDHPEYVDEFDRIHYYPSYGQPTEKDEDEAYMRGLEDAEVFLESCIREINTYWPQGEQPSADRASPPYIQPNRISELNDLKSKSFDLAKLVKMCQELNFNYTNGNYYSVIFLIRAIIDHVPPVFEVDSFGQVASQLGGKKKKPLLQRLDTTCRDLANIHIHRQVGRKEALPNLTQVNFTNELDFLLCEVIRKLGSV